MPPEMLTGISFFGPGSHKLYRSSAVWPRKAAIPVEKQSDSVPPWTRPRNQEPSLSISRTLLSPWMVLKFLVRSKRHKGHRPFGICSGFATDDKLGGILKRITKAQQRAIHKVWMRDYRERIEY